MNTVCDRYVKAKMDRNTILETMVIGFMVGIGMGVLLNFTVNKNLNLDMSLSVWTIIMFGITLTGMPYIWTKLPKIYGFGPTSIVLVMVKAAVSGMLGIVITPIMLIVRIVQTVVYRKQVKTDKMMHPYNYSA